MVYGNLMVIVRMVETMEMIRIDGSRFLGLLPKKFVSLMKVELRILLSLVFVKRT